MLCLLDFGLPQVQKRMLFMHAACKHPPFMFSLKKLHRSELLNMVQVVESAQHCREYRWKSQNFRRKLFC